MPREKMATALKAFSAAHRTLVVVFIMLLNFREQPLAFVNFDSYPNGPLARRRVCVFPADRLQTFAHP